MAKPSMTTRELLGSGIVICAIAIGALTRQAYGWLFFGTCLILWAISGTLHPRKR